jgi:pimeloyl-ACP methyl ester carboxylesterase
MIFQRFGNRNKPVIVFLHGGGLSNWMWRPQIEAFQEDYQIIAPILDGHGTDSHTTFTSISQNAAQVISYINENLDGKVFAICGLSIGAQITVEILAKANDIAQKAVIESALVSPSESIAALTNPMLNLSFPLVKNRWFAKLQAKQMYLPDSMFEEYYRDSAGMSKESMTNMLIDNARYAVPLNLEKTTADVFVLCGEKEYSMMRKSAVALQNRIKNSKLRVIPGCGHGFSLKFPEEYVELVQKHFAAEKVREGEPEGT